MQYERKKFSATKDQPNNLAYFERAPKSEKDHMQVYREKGKAKKDIVTDKNVPNLTKRK